MANTSTVVDQVKASDTVKATSALAGVTLKGQIFKQDGAYSIGLPGGKNFGGIFHAALETAEVNGRQIAVSGSYDAEGLKKMAIFEEMVRTGFHAFLNAPQSKAIQTISFGGNVYTTIRFAAESSSNPKAPVASYYLYL